MRTRNADTSKSAPIKKTPPQKTTPRTAKAAKGKQSNPKPPSNLDPSLQIKDEEVETPGEEKKPASALTAKGKAKAAKVAEVKMEEKDVEREKEVEKKEDPEKEEEEEEELEKVEENVEEPEKVEEKVEEPEKEEEKIVEPEKEEDKVEAPEKEEEKIVEPEKEEEKAEEHEKEDGKEEVEEENPEEEVPDNNENDELGDQQMEENVVEEERAVEPGNAEVAAANEEIAEGDEDHDQEQDVGAGVEEVEVQMEISDMAKARKIKKEKEIFVGGLDKEATEEDVKKVFEAVGEVLEVRILKDFVTNKNKGFAFVKFASKEIATKVLAEMKNPTICGKRCGIAPSEDNDTLFLGNICNTWTKEAIRRKLKDYGIENVVSVTLVADTQNEGRSRGFAFLEFPYHADAMVAYKRLRKPDAIFGHPERTAKVAFAEPLREPDAEVMAQVKSVFIDGLPPYWDEDQVKEQLKGYGEIERVVLARNMSTAKRKDFGFVNFTTHEAALACIEGVNNTELGDGKSKMKSRARLANPLPKTQAVKGGMSGGFRIGHSGMRGYSRFGMGFGRGRFPSNRAGFQGGRGFFPRGRGRGRGRGRFNFAANNDFESSFSENSYSEFRGGWRPFGDRGGRRISTSGRRGGFDRGQGKVFPSGRQPFAPEEDFAGPFAPRQHLGEDPYFYGDVGQGIKRPYSMMEPDPGYMEPGSRIRPRYDHPGPRYDHPGPRYDHPGPRYDQPGPGYDRPDPRAGMSGRTRYQDSLGMTGLYSHDYYGSDYGGSAYSSLYGGESSGTGHYY